MSFRLPSAWTRILVLTACVAGTAAVTPVAGVAQYPATAPYGLFTQEALPAGVWNLLRGDPTVQQQLAAHNRSDGNPPIGWFQSIPVKMRVNGEEGLIVSARGEISGGNITTFWVFLNPDGPARLVLTANAAGLDVRDSYSYGYRTIVASRSAASGDVATEYRYDGQTYQPARIRHNGLR